MLKTLLAMAALTPSMPTKFEIKPLQDAPPKQLPWGSSGTQRSGSAGMSREETLRKRKAQKAARKKNRK